MSNTPLEDQVHDALHRRVDPIQHAPLTVTDVRGRARRIQRRRAAVAGVAVAAALAIAVPVGLTMTGSSQRSVVPPATQSPSPSPTPTPQLVSGIVEVDPDSAEVVAESPVPLIDVDAPSLITSDATIDLPRDLDTLTPYLDGWVAVALNDSPDLAGATLEFLDADLVPEDGGGSPTGGMVVSPDGRRVAWSEYTGSRWQVVVADPTGAVEPVLTTFPPAPESHRVEPVGFVSEDEVAVRTFDDTLESKTYVTAGGAEPVEVPGLLQADTASPALGVVAGPVRYTPEGTCFAVVDASTSPDGGWETCDHRIGPFSPSGTYVVGIDAQADGEGSPTITVLDATTGQAVVEFEAVLPRRTFGGFWTQMAWVGDEALVARMYRGEESFMMQLGLDGTVQRIGIPSTGLSGLKVAVPS